MNIKLTEEAEHEMNLGEYKCICGIHTAGVCGYNNANLRRCNERCNEDDNDKVIMTGNFGVNPKDIKNNIRMQITGVTNENRNNVEIIKGQILKREADETLTTLVEVTDVQENSVD